MCKLYLSPISQLLGCVTEVVRISFYYNLVSCFSYKLSLNMLFTNCIGNYLNGLFL